MHTHSETVADLLVEARRSGRLIDDLPPESRPQSAMDAYDIQSAVLGKLKSTVGGWKVGAKAPEAEPTCAPLCAHRVKLTPAAYSLKEFSVRGIELEVAFKLGGDVPAS